MDKRLEAGDLLENGFTRTTGHSSSIPIEHGQFIYSSREQRNDYQQIFQFRMLNVRQKYVNVISRHQVIQKDKKGKAWIIMGVMDLSPDKLRWSESSEQL
ncbi:MAG: hypothetical protein ACLTZT_00375 [Butyricimonas faecalis]